MTVLACLALLGWWYLAVLHGRFWWPLLDRPASEPGLKPKPEPDVWPGVDIVVPARNEAEVLPQSLPTLLAQDYPGAWRVVLVDDHSSDGTAEVARRLAASAGRAGRLTVLTAPDLPPGWSGKVAAMQAGVGAGDSERLLFTDADIHHPPDSLRRLVTRAADGTDLESLMVKLRCTSFAERLLIPAFVFFFALLYPFRRAADPKSPVAAAAGGVMLVGRRALERAGGLERIKSALIDDCSLAKLIKTSGGRLRLTLTDEVTSLRPYPAVADVWSMIARTAFTQLRMSALLLLGAVAGLSLLFLWPLAMILFGDRLACAAGGAAWLLMSLLYLPTVRFYRLPWPWAFTLPLAALIYIAATIDSARRTWQGRGGLWKGRAQA